MKSAFATSWKRSIQPRKQRKYRFNVSEHTRGKFLHGHLSPTLRKKYGKRSLRIREGDKVRVMRGGFKGKEGKVEKVNVMREKIYVAKIEVNRRDGSKAQPPLRPSNLMIIELNTNDKKRMAKLTGEPVKSIPKKETKKRPAQRGNEKKIEKKDTKKESKVKKETKAKPKKAVKKEAKK